MDDAPPCSEGPEYETQPLADLSPTERLKRHQRALRSVALHQGIDGVQAYKARFPEAAALRIHSAPVAYKPKPAGYSAAIVDLVRRWFDDAGALGITNRADVEGLNKLLGTTYNPANHFSKPLPASVLRKLAALFTDRGATLDIRQIRTLSQVRKAVRAVRAGDSTGAVPMGRWGSREGDTLVVNGHAFAIERHNGHDCIRLTVDGPRLRLRMDALAEFLSQTGLAPASLPPITTTCSIGELAPDPLEAPSSTPSYGYLPENWPHSERTQPPAPGELVPDNAHEGLRARIRRLSNAPSSAPQSVDLTYQPDPLAIL